MGLELYLALHARCPKSQVSSLMSQVSCLFITPQFSILAFPCQRDSHFSLQKPISIMGGLFTGTGDCSHRFILIIPRHLLLWLLHLTMYGLLNPLTQMFYTTFMKKRDYFHCLCDTNSLPIHYLVIKNLESKILSLKTENRKLKTDCCSGYTEEALILTNQLRL